MSELPRKRIIGYADRLSAAPGDTVSFMLSCEDVALYEADIVRLRSGDLHPDGRGLLETPVDTPVNGTYSGRVQPINAGSYGVVSASGRLASLSSFTLQAWVWPTTPARGEQVLLGCWVSKEHRGFALGIDERGVLSLKLGNGEVHRLSGDTRLRARQWYWVGASFDAETSRARVWQWTQPSYPAEPSLTELEATLDVSPAGAEVPFLFAAAPEADSSERMSTAEHYNGKLEAPRVFDAALEFKQASRAQERPLGHPALIGAWDFARETSTDRFIDTGAFALHGRFVNLPTRAMTGHAWSGEIHDWKQAPEQYGAVHFHEDDLYDCAWETDFSLVIPDTLHSGVYAARVRAAEGEDRIPFVVRPAPGAPRAKTLVLLPSASYLAYANEHCACTGGGEIQIAMNHLMALSEQDLLLDARPDLGYSMYDVHADGSGVGYSSRLRPVLNFRPCVTNAWVGAAGTIPWQFNADLPLLDWLEQTGRDFDVATDEDLHAEGLSLLEPYRVVLTGSHPEYYSTAMYDALDAYLRRGGRLMYLGGNGFYWRIAYHPTLPGVIELRRAEDGIRDWVADPGEYYMSFTGEYGGMWQRNGRPIQSLVGVGMAGQGFDVCGSYRRTAAADNPRASFILAGIDDDLIGDFGTVGGGAAGIEVDRFALDKGSPRHALVVATSQGLPDTYYPGPEDINSAHPAIDGAHNPEVRADMTFFETPGGGAVFSVGSIAWLGSLSWNGFDNNVARVMENVLARFLEAEPFEMPPA